VQVDEVMGRGSSSTEVARDKLETAIRRPGMGDPSRGEKVLARMENEDAVLEVVLMQKLPREAAWTPRRVGFRLISRNHTELAVQSPTALVVSATVDGKKHLIPLSEFSTSLDDPEEHEGTDSSSRVPINVTRSMAPWSPDADDGESKSFTETIDAEYITIEQEVHGLGVLRCEVGLVSPQSTSSFNLLEAKEAGGADAAAATRGMMIWRGALSLASESRRDVVVHHFTLLKGRTAMSDEARDSDPAVLARRRRLDFIRRLEVGAMVALSGGILVLAGLIGKLDPSQTLGGLSPRAWLLITGLCYYAIQRRGTDDSTGLISMLMLCLVGLYDDTSLLWARAAIATGAIGDYAYRRFYRNTVIAPTGDRSVLINGWQSWSFCGSVLQGQPMPRPGLPAVYSGAFHEGGASGTFEVGPWEEAPREETLRSDMFAVVCDRVRRFGLVAGFLSQREQFGAVTLDTEQTHIAVHCACDDVTPRRGALLRTDWATLMLMPTLPREPLREYMLLTAKLNQAPRFRLADVHTGWCSWYHYMYDISEECIRSNLEHLVEKRREYPVSLFQIDDGYEPHWGDWTKIKRSFPLGEESLRNLSRDIAHANIMPGIWLAPFSADKRSMLERAHPEWVLRDMRGVACNSANCGKFFYGLDITRADVQEHARRTLRRAVEQWNFKYLKLDFLYSAVLNGQRSDRTVTRAQALQKGFALIRESVAKDTFVLGCGAPLGAALGFVNAMRVTADTGPTWKPMLPLPTVCGWNLPCARNMVRNTMTRLSMHARWWVNDPDCVLLRENTSLTHDETVGVATVVAMSGGMTLVSDDLLEVSDDRMRIGKSFSPVTGRAAIALDLMHRQMPEQLYLRMSRSWRAEVALPDWHVLSLCNWSDRPERKAMELEDIFSDDSDEALTEHEPQVVHVFEFWSRSYQLLRRGASHPCQLDAGTIGAHSARLFAIRRAEPSWTQAQFVGSDIHFTSGMEVVGFDAPESRREVRLDLLIGRDVDHGHVWLVLPGSCARSSVTASGSAFRDHLTERDVSHAPRGHTAPSSSPTQLPREDLRIFHVQDDVWRVRVALRHNEPCDLVVRWT